MSVNKSVLTMFRRSNAVSSLFCNKCNLMYPDKQSSCTYKNFGTKIATNQKPDFNRAILEAERIVGYATSFSSLRWLGSDEIANVAYHLRRLVGSNHPFIKTAKNLIYNGRNNMQTWGLIVLLISKAAGQLNIDDIQQGTETGILQSQRALAEITEMIRTSYLIHKGLVNIQPGDYPESTVLNDIAYGNKIALLSGDYLLGNSSVELASLRNQDVVELMSSSIKDLAEAEFLGRRDSQNNPLPSIPPEDCTNYAINEWALRNVLSAGALLGKSCKGSLQLAGQNKEIQEHGYNFGEYLALAWQACLDLGPFISNDRSTPFDLCSAPVMFHIERDPSILVEIDKGLESVQNVDYTKVYDIVINGPGIELTKELQRDYSQRAMEVLSVFHESDARTALANIITAMGDF